MPYYEYRCPECGTHYNLRLPVEHETPVCGCLLYPTSEGYCNTECVLVLHPVGIHFKGDGWTEKGDKR